MKFKISGNVTVSCWTEVEADSLEEAIEIANDRTLSDISIDGSYPVDEYWHIDTDGSPKNLTSE